jgi:hypothetical protein
MVNSFFLIFDDVWGVEEFPSSRGGVDATSIRCREASFNGADGVVAHTETHPVSDHPVCGRFGGFATFY